MGRRLALLIATYEYEDTGLRRLTTPAHDAEALAAVLEDPRIAGFEVRTLVNAPTHQVGEAIAEFYSESQRDDLTLLYFTGHGLKDDNGRLHLAMANTRRENLRFTALSAQLVDEAMNDSMSRQKILILDCCYSGSYEVQRFAKSDSAVHTLEKLGGRGRTVLTASDSTQYAFEGSKIHGEAAQSVFTSHLVAGLRDGSADLDRDGDITVDELYNYVYDRVTAEQPNQRPKKLDQVEGRTVVASNVNWSLPSHIKEAVASPIPAARQAAIEPLGQLLWANNVLVRRTARGQLEQLRDDDSRAVSTAAQAMLDAPARQPIPMPIATTGTRATRQRQPDITLGAVLGATLRRWRSRLIPTASPLPVYGLSLVAATSLVAAVIVASEQGDWAGAVGWYLTAAAVATCASVVLQWRLGAGLVAGSLGSGVVGASLLIGWITGQIRPVSGGLGSQVLLWCLAGLGHAAWIAAGVAGLLSLRRDLSFDVRRLRGRVWIVVGLGVVAAVAQLVIQFYDQYQSQLDFRWAYFYPMALSIVATELAIAGPLIASLINRGHALLVGWVLGGFAGWIGVYRGQRGFAEPTTAVIVLFAAWLALAVLAVTSVRRESAEVPAEEPVGVSGEEPPAEPAEDPPHRRLVVAIAAALVLPVVLGGAVIAVGPRGPQTPLVIGMAVAPYNDLLYAADLANEQVLKINTNTRQREGDALDVGKQPYEVLLAPDGHRLYVANSGANSISVIDVDNWKVIGKPIPVGPEPFAMALSPTTNRLFVLSSKAATITVVDTEKMSTEGGPVSSGADPRDLAVGQDGKRLYVANGESSSVSVLDTITRRPAHARYKLTALPSRLSMTQDNYLYVLTGSSYSVINTNVDNPQPSPVSLPGKSTTAALSDDGSLYFVLGAPPGDTSGRKQAITVIDTKRREVIGTAEDDTALSVSIAVSHDNQRVYVSGFYGEGLLIVDATIPKTIGRIEIPK